MSKIKMRSVSLLAMLIMLLTGALAASATPAEAAPGCTPAGFCMHDTSTSNPHASYSGAVDRNTCITGMSSITSFLTENTGVQWWLFRTTTCGGSHIAVHSFTDLNLTVSAPTYDNSVVAIMRTSTIG